MFTVTVVSDHISFGRPIAVGFARPPRWYSRSWQPQSSHGDIIGCDILLFPNTSPTIGSEQQPAVDRCW